MGIYASHSVDPEASDFLKNLTEEPSKFVDDEFDDEEFELQIAGLNDPVLSEPLMVVPLNPSNPAPSSLSIDEDRLAIIETNRKKAMEKLAHKQEERRKEEERKMAQLIADSGALFDHNYD
jgi:hypothetical protein